MKTTLRKQYSKNYQVFEITVEDAPQESRDLILRAMDTLAEKELGEMVKLVSDNNVSTIPSTPKPATTYTPRPQYDNAPRQQQGGNIAPSVKQLEWLKKKGIQFDPATITKAEASRLLDGVFGHDKANNAPKQAYQAPREQYNEPTPPSSFDVDLPF